MPPSGPMHHSNNWNQNRGNIDMPNLQSLGINPNGQNGPPNQGGNVKKKKLACSSNAKHLTIFFLLAFLQV